MPDDEKALLLHILDANRVTHLTAVERIYFLGEDTKRWAATFRPRRTATTGDVVAAYREVVERANGVVDACRDLALPGPRPARSGPTPSMRWTIVHVIEETARHAGHADILREQIDGATGDGS